MKLKDLHCHPSQLTRCDDAAEKPAFLITHTNPVKSMKRPMTARQAFYGSLSLLVTGQAHLGGPVVKPPKSKWAASMCTGQPSPLRCILTTSDLFAGGSEPSHTTQVLHDREDLGRMPELTLWIDGCWLARQRCCVRGVSACLLSGKKSPCRKCTKTEPPSTPRSLLLFACSTGSGTVKLQVCCDMQGIPKASHILPAVR